MKNDSSPITIIVAILLIIGIVYLIYKYFLWVVIGVVAIVIIIIAFLLISNYKKKKILNKDVSGGVTQGQINEYIKSTNKRIQDIRRYYYKLKDEDMRQLLDDTCQNIKKIIKMIEDDPKDFKVIRRFLNTIITSLETIVHEAANLYTIVTPNDNTKATIANTKDALGLINTSIHNQINKLYENNIMHLDVEIEVLRKSLNAKGLLNENMEDNTNE